ncbi:hypothetical protein [Aliihoeflea sp. PC F10.4]
MNRTASAFLLVAAIAGLLMALGFGLQMKGYAFGQLGNGRLAGLASSASFMPLAAIYALTGALVMLLPLRAAAFVHSHGSTPIHSTALMLLAIIVGVAVSRFAFGVGNALWTLADWQLAFAAGIVIAHLAMERLRKNVLLRSVAFVAFTAAMLACLYWTFRL